MPEDPGFRSIPFVVPSLNYLMDKQDVAYHWTNFTAPNVEAGVGHFSFADYHLFQSLVLIKRRKDALPVARGPLPCVLLRRAERRHGIGVRGADFVVV